MGGSRNEMTFPSSREVPDYNRNGFLRGEGKRDYFDTKLEKLVKFRVWFASKIICVYSDGKKIKMKIVWRKQFCN